MIVIASMARRAALVLLAASLALSACSDDGGSGSGSPSATYVGSGSGSPTATYVGSFEVGADRVAGYGTRVAAYTYPRLAVYEQDPVNPTLLAHSGTLPACACNANEVTLNEQWIAVAGGQWVNGTQAYVPVVQLVRAEGPYAEAGKVLPAGMADYSDLDRATAWNDRLVTASGPEIRLYDITSLAAPVLLGTFDAGGPSTAIAAAAGGVFVFTDNGYVFVDLADGTFSAIESAALAGVDSAYTYGGKIRVGGRSRYAGYKRVARLDPAGAPTLVIEADYDRIVDREAPGNTVGKMSFDAAREQYVVLAETKPPSMSGEQGSSAVLRFSDGASIAPIDGVRIDRSVDLTDPNTDFWPSMHVNGGLLCLIPDASPSNIPVYRYLLP